MSRHSRQRSRRGHGWPWRRSHHRSAGWVIASAAAAMLLVLAVIVVCIRAIAQQIAPPPGFSAAETIGTADDIVLRTPTLSDGAVKFYRYVSVAGRETRFFMVRTPDGVVRSALDACDECFRDRRGFRHRADHVICNSCGRVTPLRAIAVTRGGCRPVPLEHRLQQHDRVTVAAAALQSGGRYF